MYNQKPNLTQYTNGVPVIPSTLSFDNFTSFKFDGTLFSKINKRFTFFSELQAGINFTDKPNVLNNLLFYIGGINGNFRNQVKFAGLQEATVNSGSVLALQWG